MKRKVAEGLSRLTLTLTEREVGVEIMEAHESAKIIVDGDLNVHSTSDPAIC